MAQGEPTPPGWYYAQGDPPGTQRYWNGELWQGEPTPAPPAMAPSSAGGYIGGPGSTHYSESNQATAALVVSILGLVLCAILAPVGWYLANQELRGIDYGLRDPSPRGQAVAAKVIGIIGTALIALAIIAIIAIFIFAAAGA